MRSMLVALAILLAGARSAAGAEFVVKPGSDNKVVFISKATVEGFEGRTNKLEGRITVDPANLGDSVSVHFEVDMASLDTGIAKRNQHMRQNHLETDKYPKSVFDGVSVRAPAGAKLVPGQPDTLDVEGTFTLHGVSRRLRIKVETTFDARGTGRIAFKTGFPVALPDYAISRPEFLFLKLAEVQQVRVSGVAVGAPAAPAAAP